MPRGYVGLRRGLLDHLPVMKAREVKLFDYYILRADFKRAICWDDLDETAKGTGWSRRTVSTVRQELIDRHFIVPNKPGVAGIWIPKSARFKDGKVIGHIRPPAWARRHMEAHW